MRAATFLLRLTGEPRESLRRADQSYWADRTEEQMLAKETGKPGEFDGPIIATKRERIVGIARELGLDRIGASERLAFAGPTIEVEASDT